MRVLDRIPLQVALDLFRGDLSRDLDIPPARAVGPPRPGTFRGENARAAMPSMTGIATAATRAVTMLPCAPKAGAAVDTVRALCQSAVNRFRYRNGDWLRARRNATYSIFGWLRRMNGGRVREKRRRGEGPFPTRPTQWNAATIMVSISEAARHSRFCVRELHLWS